MTQVVQCDECNQTLLPDHSLYYEVVISVTVVSPDDADETLDKTFHACSKDCLDTVGRRVGNATREAHTVKHL